MAIIVISKANGKKYALDKPEFEMRQSEFELYKEPKKKARVKKVIKSN